MKSFALGWTILTLVGSGVTGATEIRFAEVKEAAELLREEDDYILRLSPFDLRVRMNSEEVPELADFIDFIAKSPIEWPAEERDRLEEAWSILKPVLDELGVRLPDVIPLIRTDGSEDFGNGYTRGEYIVFHPDSLDSQERANSILAHELFHLLTRKDPALRDRLYEIIGFVPCGEIAHPQNLAELRISNPDAPINQHAIKLDIGGDGTWAVPLLYARTEFAPADPRPDLFAFLMMSFVVVEKNENGKWDVPLGEDDQAIFISVFRARGFQEQIGSNTNYIIHPEEILADNFQMLLLGQTEGKPSPDIFDKMRKEFAREPAPIASE